MKKIMNFEDTEFSLRGFHLFSWVSHVLCVIWKFPSTPSNGKETFLCWAVDYLSNSIYFLFSFPFDLATVLAWKLSWSANVFFFGFCVVLFYRSWGFSSMLQSSSQSRKGGWQVVVICVGDMVTVLALVTNSVSFPLAVVITAKKIFSGIDNRVYSWS